MVIMKKLLLATSALVAFAAGAQAADLGAPRMPIAAAVVAPAYNWTGFFIGGQVGYEWARFARVNTNAFANTYNGSGLVGGIHAGYNWQGASPLVVGVIADIEAAGVNGNDGAVGGGLDRGRINWQGSLRARLGFAADRALIYATGGLAFGWLDSRRRCGIRGQPELVGRPRVSLHRFRPCLVSGIPGCPAERRLRFPDDDDDTCRARFAVLSLRDGRPGRRALLRPDASCVGGTSGPPSGGPFALARDIPLQRPGSRGPVSTLSSNCVHSVTSGV
jgi:opacity protein-like surface antigen